MRLFLFIFECPYMTTNGLSTPLLSSSPFLYVEHHARRCAPFSFLRFFLSIETISLVPFLRITTTYTDLLRSATLEDR